MALTTETDLLTAIKSHRRTLLEREWHQQSLENGFPVMQTTEVQDVLKQVDNADFYCDLEYKDCDFVPQENYCSNPDCPECPSEIKAEHEAYHRPEAVAKFFADFDALHSDSDPDPVCLALREIEIGITQAEWDEHRAQKAAEDAEIAREF